ncbi:MAG TPA: helix-hairpin-helix domain-containing protein [Segeticoccus sp.]|nr:helix-hairpin-helix domain-containing protein [Segeticoccus sp.]
MPRARLPRLRRRRARPPGRHREGRRGALAASDASEASDTSDTSDEEGEPVAGPRVLSVPSSLVDVRARPKVAAVLGVALVLVLAAAFFGVRVLLARHAAAPQPVAAVTSSGDQPDPGGTGGPLPSGAASSSGGAAGAAGAPGGAASGAASGATGAAAGGGDGSRSGPAPAATPLPSTASVLLVHVVGQVRHPGVVRLKPGARVQDAVEAAGGATAHADLSAVNLARPVADGEQVRIPKPGEQAGPPPGAAGGPAAGAPGAGGAAAGVPGGAGADVPVDLNSATQEQLESLPGVGPVLAQRILEWRTAHGRFSSVDELLEVSGIGDKTFADLRPKVTV